MPTVTTEVKPPEGAKLQEEHLEGASFKPCAFCGHRDVRAYGQLLVCAICKKVFWRSES